MKLHKTNEEHTKKVADGSLGERGILTVSPSMLTLAEKRLFFPLDAVLKYLP